MGGGSHLIDVYVFERSPSHPGLSADGAEQMTKAVYNGSAPTNYTYAGADQKSILSIATPGGDNRPFRYGHADQNGNPTLTSSTTNGDRSNIVDDAKTGQPIDLSTPSNVLGRHSYDGSGGIWGPSTTAPQRSMSTTPPTAPTPLPTTADSTPTPSASKPVSTAPTPAS